MRGRIAISCTSDGRGTDNLAPSASASRQSRTSNLKRSIAANLITVPHGSRITIVDHQRLNQPRSIPQQHARIRPRHAQLEVLATSRPAIPPGGHRRALDADLPPRRRRRRALSTLASSTQQIQRRSRRSRRCVSRLRAMSSRPTPSALAVQSGRGGCRAATPARVGVEDHVREPDPALIVLGDDREAARCWSAAAETARPRPAGGPVDVTVEERVAVDPAIVPAPAVGVQRRDQRAASAASAARNRTPRWGSVIEAA